MLRQPFHTGPKFRIEHYVAHRADHFFSRIRIEQQRSRIRNFRHGR